MPSAATWIQQGFALVVVVGLATAISRQLYQIGVKLSQARSAGSYQLKSKLGEGGLGEVWRAEHRMLARPAAVKLILPERLGAGGCSGPASSGSSRGPGKPVLTGDTPPSWYLI